MTEGLSVADAMALRGNEGTFGGEGGWFVWVFFLFFLLAWGGNGGLFGRNNGIPNQINNDFLYTNLKQTLDTGFTQNANQNFAIQRDLLQGFNTVQLADTQGFNNVNNGISNLGFNMQNCCCETNRNIDSVRYENAKNTCDIITNANMNTRDIIESNCANTRAIIDKITNTEIQALRDKITAQDRDIMTVNFQLSQNAQTQNLINTLQPVSKPAYLTCSPYQSTLYPYGYNGCSGCNCAV